MRIRGVTVFLFLAVVLLFCSSCGLVVSFDDYNATGGTARRGPVSGATEVTVTNSGHGSVTSLPAGISCGAICTANFVNTPAPVSVTLTATPDANHDFVGWSDGCRGTDTACVLLLDAGTKSVTANFAPKKFSLSITLAGTGSVTSSPAGIDCGTTAESPCSAMFGYGATVTLTASPTAGSAFTGWGPPCSGRGTCSVTITGATEVVASFLPPPTITDFVPAGGTGIGQPVTINGTNFTGASAVTFNGANQPTFSVVSATQILTTVPAGATTGPVAVTTPSGTATSAAYNVIVVDVTSLTVLSTPLAGCVDISFSYALTQAQSLSANVLVEVDPGTGIFQPASEAGAAGAQPAATSPGDTAHVFHWNSTVDVPHATITNARVRVSAAVSGVAGSGGASLIRSNIVVTNGLVLATAVSSAAGSGQGFVRIADLNGDGKPDLVSSGGNILLGNGNGTFQAPVAYPDGGVSVLIGDVNVDGMPDLVVGHQPGTFSVLLGNGDATFQPPVSYPTGVGVTLESMAMGDLNGDGKPDLAVTHQGSTNNLSILLGNGDGSSRPR